MIDIYTTETLGSSPFTALLVNRHIIPHKHYFWEFTYSVNGTIFNIINNTPIETHALTEIILIKPGDVHEIVKEDMPSENSVQWHRDIYVAPEKLKQICDFLDKNLYSELTASKNPIIDARSENLETLEYTLNLFKIYGSYLTENIDFLEKLHTTVIFQILGIYLKNKCQSKKHYPPWIESFFERLKTESFICRNIDDIIGEYNYSHGYLCREFKKHVGKTMVECLKESRVIYSTVLLMDKSLSILDIAMRLNYNSQSAYINAFKKIYGLSPNKWRNKQLNV